MLDTVNRHVRRPSLELVRRVFSLQIASVQARRLLGQGSQTQLTHGRPADDHVDSAHSQNGEGADAGSGSRFVAEELVGTFEPAEQREVRVIAAFDVDFGLSGRHYLWHNEARDVERARSRRVRDVREQQERGPHGAGTLTGLTRPLPACTLLIKRFNKLRHLGCPLARALGGFFVS